jgi:hypothetical protein
MVISLLPQLELQREREKEKEISVCILCIVNGGKFPFTLALLLLLCGEKWFYNRDFAIMQQKEIFHFALLPRTYIHKLCGWRDCQQQHIFDD